MTEPLEAEEFTIDELARLTGVTGRNIRALQSKRMLPPPTIRSRTGYYGSEHVARLKMIRTLQDEGFRLEAISRLLESPGEAADRMLEFGQALRSSFGTPDSELATTTDLMTRFGGQPDERVLRKAQRLGLIRPLGEDQWEILNPRLVAAGEELAGMGIPLDHGLAVAESINRHTRAIAKEYVRLFVSDVVGVDRVSDPAEKDWAWLHEALDRLRPIALEAIRASFENAMSQQIERELKKFLQRGD
jgi:DNA-binding transcriptional MerR regulator